MRRERTFRQPKNDQNSGGSGVRSANFVDELECFGGASSGVLAMRPSRDLAGDGERLCVVGLDLGDDVGAG